MFEWIYFHEVTVQLNLICSICYITESRLDVQFVKKISLEMIIGQQMKEEGYDQINGFYIKLSIHLLLK